MVARNSGDETHAKGVCAVIFSWWFSFSILSSGVFKCVRDGVKRFMGDLDVDDLEGHFQPTTFC